MANRFDKPVESQYVSQYVPIPFEQLYRIGKEYNDRVDKAEKTLSDNIKQWGEFQSKSQKDMESWYGLTKGVVEPLVQRMAQNPDLIKTREGQSAINQLINNIDYASLNKLKQSAEAFKQRDVAIANLISKGQYNPLWHDLDVSSYDTLGTNQIFDDVNVIPYKSEVDLVRPYVDNLKDSFIKSDGLYDYTGVTSNRTDQQVKENISAIYNTPEAKMHIKTLIKQGYSPEIAKDIFTNSIYLAGREFARETRQANPFGLANYKEFVKQNGLGNQQNNRHLYLTESLELTGLKGFVTGKAKILSNTPGYSNLIEQANSEDPIIRDQANRMISEMDKYTPQQLFKLVYDKHAAKNQDGGSTLTTTQLKEGTNEIINNFSVPIKGGKLQSLLSSTIDGISDDTQQTPFGKRKIINSGQNLNFTDRFLSGVAGFQIKDNTGRKKVYDALKSNQLNDIILLSNDQLISVPSIKNGEPSTINALNIKVAISDKDLKRLGITESDMKQTGAVQIIAKGKPDNNTTTLSGSYDNDSKEINYEKISTTSSSKEDNIYWQLDLTSEIPTEGVSAEYLNQEALTKLVNPTTYSMEYGQVQQQAYDN